MRWKKQSEWGLAQLRDDEWAPLEARIRADDLDAVEEAIEELTGFMDFFREDLAGTPVVGVTDGQLAVAHSRALDTRGRRVLQVIFYAGGSVGLVTPDAFGQLAKAAASLVDHLQADGIAVQEIRWTEHPYVKRPF